jgi:hypothetical protein
LALSLSSPKPHLKLEPIQIGSKGKNDKSSSDSLGPKVAPGIQKIDSISLKRDLNGSFGKEASAPLKGISTTSSLKRDPSNSSLKLLSGLHVSSEPKGAQGESGPEISPKLSSNSLSDQLNLRDGSQPSLHSNRSNPKLDLVNKSNDKLPNSRNALADILPSTANDQSRSNEFSRYSQESLNEAKRSNNILSKKSSNSCNQIYLSSKIGSNSSILNDNIEPLQSTLDENGLIDQRVEDPEIQQGLEIEDEEIESRVTSSSNMQKEEGEIDEDEENVENDQLQVDQEGNLPLEELHSIASTTSLKKTNSKENHENIGSESYLSPERLPAQSQDRISNLPNSQECLDPNFVINKRSTESVCFDQLLKSSSETRDPEEQPRPEESSFKALSFEDFQDRDVAKSRSDSKADLAHSHIDRNDFAKLQDKFAELQAGFSQLIQEKSQLQDEMNLLKKKSEEETKHLYRRIRKLTLELNEVKQTMSSDSSHEQESRSGTPSFEDGSSASKSSKMNESSKTHREPRPSRRSTAAYPARSKVEKEIPLLKSKILTSPEPLESYDKAPMRQDDLALVESNLNNLIDSIQRRRHRPLQIAENVYVLTILFYGVKYYSKQNSRRHFKDAPSILMVERAISRYNDMSLGC